MSGKVHATILEGIVGGFEFSFFQRNLKELAQKAMEMSLRVLNESNKSRFDSYSRQERCIDHLPCYLSGLSCTFFPTTFLEIAEYKHLESLPDTSSQIFDWKDTIFLSLTGIRLSPKQARRVNDSTASLSLAELWTITEIKFCADLFPAHMFFCYKV